MPELGIRSSRSTMCTIALLPILVTSGCEGRLHVNRSDSDFQVAHMAPSIATTDLEIRDIEKSKLNVASFEIGNCRCLVRLEKGGRHISVQGSFANIEDLISLTESYCLFVPSTAFDFPVHLNPITTSEMKGITIRANGKWISRVAVQVSDNVTMFVQEVDSNKDLRFTRFCLNQFAEAATSLPMNSSDFDNMQLTVLENGWQDGIYEIKIEGPESLHGLVGLDIRDSRTFRRLQYDKDYAGWRQFETLSDVGGRKSVVWRVTMKSNGIGKTPATVEVVWTNELGTEFRTISTMEAELVNWQR